VFLDFISPLLLNIGTVDLQLLNSFCSKFPEASLCLLNSILPKAVNSITVTVMCNCSKLCKLVFCLLDPLQSKFWGAKKIVYSALTLLAGHQEKHPACKN